MVGAIITAVAAFVATNIDDLFIDTVFFAQADNKNKIKAVVLGKYFGIGFITLASWLCAAVLQSVADKYIALLGIVPIIMGIKMWLERDKEENINSIHNGKNLFFMVTLVTISQSGDNFGVYIPLFASFSTLQLVITVAAFSVLIALWCVLAKSIAEFHVFKSILLKYKDIIVPMVLILLGISILSGTFV